MVFRRVLSAFIISLSMALGSFAAELRVPDDHPTIQAALDAATPGDEILVAPGIYHEGVDFLGKSVLLRSLEGPDTTIIDAGGVGPVVRFANNEGPQSEIRGFQIRGGLGEQTRGRTFGGGIFCENASPTIANNVILQNSAESGGGLACLGASGPTIVENIIRENEATARVLGHGGGVFCTDESHPTIDQNQILENTALSGGGIASLRAAAPTITRNTIAGNRSVNDAAGIVLQFAPGGFISENDFRDQIRQGIEINSCNDVYVFDNMFAEQSNFAITIEASEGVIVSRNVLVRNDLAMLISNSSVEVQSNVVSDTRGAAIEIVNSSAGLVNNSITLTDGRALLVRSASVVSVRECTLAQNRDVDGGALEVAAGCDVEVVNSILWSKSRPPILVADSEFTASFSCIRGGWPGEGNIDVDPEFVVPGSGDPHLRLSSPCVDAGSDTGLLLQRDIDGQERVQAGRRSQPAIVDIGADELDPSIALRFGYVNQIAESVLTVNGTAGDAERVVHIGLHEPISLEMTTSSAGPQSAAFGLYAWIDAPDSLTHRKQPFGLGWTVFPTPLQMEPVNAPVEIWNNLGRIGQLGKPTRSSSLAPTVVATLSRGATVPITVTFQGFLQDVGSRGAGPVSITNAVVVSVQ